jgi:hypothetical protein
MVNRGGGGLVDLRNVFLIFSFFWNCYNFHSVGGLDLPVHTEGRAARRRWSSCDTLYCGVYHAVTPRELIHRYLGDREYRSYEGCPGREMKDSEVRSVLPDC